MDMMFNWLGVSLVCAGTNNSLYLAAPQHNPPHKPITMVCLLPLSYSVELIDSPDPTPGRPYEGVDEGTVAGFNQQRN